MALSIFEGRHLVSIATQLSDPLSSGDDSQFDGMPVATWRGRRFVKDDDLWKKGGRPFKSWIKDHGFVVREVVHDRIRRMSLLPSLPSGY